MPVASPCPQDEYVRAGKARTGLYEASSDTWLGEFGGHVARYL